MIAPATGKVHLTVVTDARSGTAHLVTEEAMAAGRPTGRYVGLCDGEVIAASLTTPARGYCRRCRHRRASQ